MKDLGEAKRILGMEIVRDTVKGKVSLTQKTYLQKVLQKFDIWCETKSLNTPLVAHFKLLINMSLKTDDEREYVSRSMRTMGSLMYAMVCTRPDLSQAVSMVSRYMHHPGKGH